MGEGSPGDVLGGCRIEEVVGRGGMGVVYRARQVGLDRVVALKVIAPERLGDDGARARFLREARAAASVDHPNVLPVHAAGVEGDRAYLVTKYVAGRDLESVVRIEGAMAPARAAAVVGAVADGLDAIHSAGLVHRDVKPANVLLDEAGHVWVGDFGLARPVDGGTGPTDPGAWVGTAGFAAPEQIRGEAVDARTDVYALGCVLFFTLTGRSPFARESVSATMWAHLTDAPPWLPPGLQAFDPVVSQALSKAPGDRFASAGELGAAARAAAAGEWTGAETLESPRRRQPPPRRGRRGLAVAGAAVLLAAGAGTFLAIDGGGKEPDPVPTPSPTATPAPTATPDRTTTVDDVGKQPRGIALAAGDVWVVSLWNGRLTRTDAERPDRAWPAARVGTRATDIAADGDRLWVTNPGTDEVLEVDAVSRTIVRRSPVEWPFAVEVDRGGLWVASRAVALSERPSETPDLLRRLDRRGMPIRDPVPIDGGIRAIAVGGGFVWVSLWDEGTILQLTKGGKEVDSFQIGQSANYLAYGDGRLWASVPTLSTVYEFRRNAPRRPYRVGPEPADIAVDGREVYVAIRGVGEVRVLTRGDPRARPERIRVPLGPVDIAAGYGAVWVTGTTAPRGKVTRILPR